MMAAILSLCLAVMTSADAVTVVLNSSNAVSRHTFEVARATLERDAAAGKPLQQFVVGLTTSDKQLADKYLTASRPLIRTLAEKRNNPLAWYLLSVDENSAVKLERAANGGNVQALNALGTMALGEAYSRPDLGSNRVERILQKSFECFRRATIHNDPNGFINLGTCYLTGLGCQQDMAMAFRCFQSAAEAGHPEGMDNLSAAYQFGHGIAKDAELSLYWAMRARAARGSAAAAKWLKERR